MRLFFLVLILLSGCASPQTISRPNVPAVPEGGVETLASGVVHRALAQADGTGIEIIDIDLVKAKARPAIVTERIQRVGACVVGEAYTPSQWLSRTGAIAAINGGYFGRETAPGQKEIVGLLVKRGRVRRASPPIYGRGGATVKRGYFVRSAFGLTSEGMPTIIWAATDTANLQSLKAYSSPTTIRGKALTIADAIGCGPMLIQGGRNVVTDYSERLVSPGPQARTFVAYDNPFHQPRHLIMGMSSGSTFRDLAAFITVYFPHYDHSKAVAAMCLDGGASAQMTYRGANGFQSPRDTDVSVPDAIVLLPNH